MIRPLIPAFSREREKEPVRRNACFTRRFEVGS